jgi:hypothetical protein
MASKLPVEADTNLGNDKAPFFSGATFMPYDSPSRTDALLEEVWRLRQSTLLAFALKIESTDLDLFTATHLADFLKAFVELPLLVRREFVEYPPFRIWLKQSIQLANGLLGQDDLDKTILMDKLTESRDVLNRFFENREDSKILRIPGTLVQVQRFDVDPLIAQVSPPSYQFPDKKKQHALESKTAYRLPFFLEVATIALERINQTWQEAYQDFQKFVKTIVHVTDANFRSCSADRYSGVIFLSADDASLLEVDESLIHEYGHQILYNIMELDSLVSEKWKPGKLYKLPWSGAERDLYGYFHAFYIYTLLACYYERIQGRNREEQKRALDRVDHILRGLIEALPDFEIDLDFTPRGRHLFEVLSGRINTLWKRHKKYIS